MIANSAEKYGENYQSHCLEMYKLYVEGAEKISDRRHLANSFFLTINTALIGIVGYVGGSIGKWNWVVSVAGIALCWVWCRLIRSYKDLNSGKFKVVHEIEKELPLAPYDAEWEALGRGTDSKLYLQFTRIEKLVPLIFGVLHIMAVIPSIPWDKLIFW